MEENKERNQFDVQRLHNGDYVIYTSYYNEFGDRVWVGNNVCETDLLRIIDNINKAIDYSFK